MSGRATAKSLRSSSPRGRRTASPPRSQPRSPPSRAQSPPPRSQLSPSGRDPIELAGVFYRGTESEVKRITKPDLLFLGAAYHAPVSPDMKKADIEATVRAKQNSYLDADAHVSADRRALADDRAAVAADRRALDRDLGRESALLLEYGGGAASVSRNAETRRTPRPSSPPPSRRASPRTPEAWPAPAEFENINWPSPRSSPPRTPRTPSPRRSPAGSSSQSHAWNASEWVLPDYFRAVDVREFTRLAKTAHEDKTEDVGSGLVMHLAKRPEEKYARRLYAVGLATDPDEYQQMRYLVAEPLDKREHDDLVKLHTGAWTNFPYRTVDGDTSTAA